MSAIDDILGKLPVDQLAGQLGSDPGEVRQAASTAIESLLGGLSRNASDPLGQVSLASALKDHTSSSLLGKPSVDVGDIDTTDGAKIVQHALGADPARAAQAIGGGANQSLIQRLLPIVAPLVLAYLASRLGNKQTESTQGGGILDAILGRGGQLGSQPSEDYQRGYQDGYNAARQEGQQDQGLNLGDIIGGMLGGGQTQQQSTSGLGGLLGGLFG
ncbi:DUF937 domain-containing protein [Brooklawnia cerclae]|uniref:DUF937 domain-containing protein n=1 Tax=Brooklawnia cerclae TaxID=349934 RepID=A0ABX0SF80_9ACTN|nr:DUF937 domain-containing protein [Brooklawnia cerclae]NIH55958.1 hypothetical protein [Brooklawnia cerclae]